MFVCLNSMKVTIWALPLAWFVILCCMNSDCVIFTQARAILLMRYPQSSSVTSDDKQATRTSSGVETVPHPSLSGLSFALCAASLPLLRCRDMVLSAKVHQLLRLVVKLVPEVSFSFCELSSDINDLNVKRFQYLLNRVEQVCALISLLKHDLCMYVCMYLSTYVCAVVDWNTTTYFTPL